MTDLHSTEIVDPDQITRSLVYKAPFTDLEAFVLVDIAKHTMEGASFYGALAKIGTDQMSRIVKKLVGLGYLHERKNPADRRFSQLGMTRAGLAALQEMVDNRGMGKSFPVGNVWIWEGDPEPTWIGPRPKPERKPKPED